MDSSDFIHIVRFFDIFDDKAYVQTFRSGF